MTASLKVLAEEVRSCTACDLYVHATQAVFGAGPTHARIAAVGEQPGDSEDRQGKPFVGPAGRVLSRAFEESGIDREQVYVTNAVKHFKFEERGKRRIHKKPDAAEILACRPWLEAEMRALGPEVIIAMGVTAAQSLLNKRVTIGSLRGEFVEHPWARALFVTIHPSAILRAQPEDRDREFQHFVQDMRAVAGWVREHKAA
jgi:uracil-DNA glycosylase family protein